MQMTCIAHRHRQSGTLEKRGDAARGLRGLRDSSMFQVKSAFECQHIHQSLCCLVGYAYIVYLEILVDLEIRGIRPNHA